MADLPSWNDTPTRQAIIEFVEQVARDVPVAERVAVFDNDGTLWCEKPMQPEIGFLLERLAAMAEADASLRERQPWKAAHEGDLAWIGGAITKHYRGDDGDVKLLIAGVIQAFAGWTVEAYAEEAGAYLRERSPPDARPPAARVRLPADGRAAALPGGQRLRVLHRLGREPRLHAHDHARHVRHPARAHHRQLQRAAVPGGRRDGGSVVYLAEPDVFDDGPVKPIRIWSRIGRRPLLVAGNANGDIPALRFAGGPERPRCGSLVRHDDAEREFDYTAGAETVPRHGGHATAGRWSSVRDDWATVFA